MADLSDDIRSFIQDGIDPVTYEEISGHRRRRLPRRRTVARVASVAVLVAVAVPVILAVSSARSTTNHNSHAQARRRVIAALDATIASGSFNISFSQQPLTAPTSPTTTTTNACSPSALQFEINASRPTTNGSPPLSIICEGDTSGGDGLAISGQGTIDTNPFAMVVNTQIPNLGHVGLRDDGTSVWEDLSDTDEGLAPEPGNDGSGQSLPDFSSLVESTLGARQGALDMMVLANPTGYLELDENAITTADPLGTGTVDGVPVTAYQVSLDPAQEATVSGTNTSESTAIEDALDVLKAQGYTGTTVKISIDAAGYIRQTVSTANFSDGASQTGETTFSDFGCAGTVLMPGQTGATSPPASCVSVDGTTTTTTAVTQPPDTTSSIPTTTLATSSPIVPAPLVTTTTTASSTTTSAPPSS